MLKDFSNVAEVAKFRPDRFTTPGTVGWLKCDSYDKEQSEIIALSPDGHPHFNY